MPHRSAKLRLVKPPDSPGKFSCSHNSIPERLLRFIVNRWTELHRGNIIKGRPEEAFIDQQKMKNFIRSKPKLSSRTVIDSIMQFLLYYRILIETRNDEAPWLFDPGQLENICFAVNCSIEPDLSLSLDEQIELILGPDHTSESPDEPLERSDTLTPPDAEPLHLEHLLEAMAEPASEPAQTTTDSCGDLVIQSLQNGFSIKPEELQERTIANLRTQLNGLVEQYPELQSVCQSVGRFAVAVTSLIPEEIEAAGTHLGICLAQTVRQTESQVIEQLSQPVLPVVTTEPEPVKPTVPDISAQLSVAQTEFLTNQRAIHAQCKEVLQAFDQAVTSVLAQVDVAETTYIQKMSTVLSDGKALFAGSQPVQTPKNDFSTERAKIHTEQKKHQRIFEQINTAWESCQNDIDELYQLIDNDWRPQLNLCRDADKPALQAKLTTLEDQLSVLEKHQELLGEKRLQTQKYLNELGLRLNALKILDSDLTIHDELAVPMSPALDPSVREFPAFSEVPLIDAEPEELPEEDQTDTADPTATAPAQSSDGSEAKLLTSRPTQPPPEPETRTPAQLLPEERLIIAAFHVAGKKKSFAMVFNCLRDCGLTTHDKYGVMAQCTAKYKTAFRYNGSPGGTSLFSLWPEFDVSWVDQVITPADQSRLREKLTEWKTKHPGKTKKE
jgi:hypothetical protein